MPLIDVIWDLPDDPDGNLQHIAEHGLTPIDVKHVFSKPDRRDTSRWSGRPIVFGKTPSGERIAVLYEEIDEDTVYPITAYRVEECTDEQEKVSRRIAQSSLDEVRSRQVPQDSPTGNQRNPASETGAGQGGDR